MSGDRKAGYSGDCRGSNHLLCQRSGARCTCVCHGVKAAPAKVAAAPKVPASPKVPTSLSLTATPTRAAGTPAHVPLAEIIPPPLDPSVPSLSDERARVLDAVREHGPIHLSDLEPIVGEIQHTTLHWHVLILGDRGLVEWVDRVTEPKVQARA